MPENQDDQKLDELLRGEFADRLGEAGKIGDEELAAYVAGELNQEQEADLQRRLESSPEAVQRLLDLEELMAPVESAGTADFETAAAWQALAPRLEEARASSHDSPEASAGTSPQHAGAGPQYPGSHRWLPAVAALLAFCVLGLGWQNLRLSGVAKNLREQLTTATPDLPVIYFDANRSGNEGVRLAADDSGWVVLMLGPYPWLEAKRLKVEVQGRSAVVWSGILELPELGAARLGLPRQLVPAGEYQIRVTAGEQTVAEYSFVTERPAGRPRDAAPATSR